MISQFLEKRIKMIISLYHYELIHFICYYSLFLKIYFDINIPTLAFFHCATVCTMCLFPFFYFQHVVVQSLSHVWFFATPWTSQSLTISQSLLKLMSSESVMPSSHLILCCQLFLLPSVFSSIRVFSSDLIVHIRWPKYWSFSFSISPSNEYSGLTSFRND